MKMNWLQVLIPIFLTHILCVISEPDICRPHESHCQGAECKTEKLCDNGECQPDGSCLCNPCYNGDSCDIFEDKYYPKFIKEEEMVIIDVAQKGVIYEAIAEDEDEHRTCSPNSIFPCPCAKAYYYLTDDEGQESLYFAIDIKTAKISISQEASFESGQTFELIIIATNFDEDEEEGTGNSDKLIDISTMILNVRVGEMEPMEKLLLASERSSENFSAEINKQGISYDEMEVKRIKRKAVGATVGDTNFTIAITNLPIEEPIKPGQSINFQLTILLPEITSADPMDLLVEIYVKDTLSEITTMSVCGITVDSVGDGSDMIKKALDDQTLTVADGIITTFPSKEFGTFNDHATVDFGSIYNQDTTGAGTGYEPSTIIISFSATMIINTNFTNATAIVTAGSEYKSSDYVWVAQASFTYDSSSTSFPNSISVLGPETIPAQEAAYYEIEAIITDAYEQVSIEVYSPLIEVDKFSVTYLGIGPIGSNHECMSTDQPVVTYQKSITGRTHYRATFDFLVMTSNLDWANALAGEDSEAENKIIIGFNILAVDAKEGDIITLGTGIILGATTLWSGVSNITIGAALASSGVPPTSLDGYALDTRTPLPAVYIGQTAAYGLKFGLASAGTPTAISCTATPGTGNKICGVVYGPSGKYVGNYPDLLTAVTYNDDGSATWDVTVKNSHTHPTDQTKDTTQEYIVIEVTVMYTDVAQSGTVACGGFSYTLSAQAGSIITDDVSGTVLQLGDDINWYYGSTAGFVTTFTLSANGVPYTNASFDVTGDALVSNWGTKICSIDVLKVGRGSSCMSKGVQDLSLTPKYFNTTDLSPFDDAATSNFGELCGSYIDDSSATDYDVSFRVVYEIPISQTFTDSNYNISIGLLLNDVLIWTGWSDFSATSGAIAAPAADKLPMVNIVDPETTDAEQYRPFVTKINIKAYRGTIANYKVKATSVDASLIEICKIIIIQAGKNYPCLDTSPYENIDDPMKVVKTIHDPINPGASAELDMGLVRNSGFGTTDKTQFPDEDTIQIGVVARPIASSGVASITVTYTDGRATPIDPLQYNFTVVAHTPTTVDSIYVNATGLDDTLEYYEDVMKETTVVLYVPDNYDRFLHLEFVSTDRTVVKICYATLTWAGLNIPCIFPINLVSEPIADAVKDIIKIDLMALCHVPMSTNITENQLFVRVGVMSLDNTATSASFYVLLYENGEATPASTTTITITKSANAFVPSNFSSSDIGIFPVENTTVPSVEPGSRIWNGIYVAIPAFLTIPVELTIQTESLNGHAKATVHGFRWGNSIGKNLGCILDFENYESTLSSNSTDGVSMIHESQTNTLVADLKYITNTGVSYLLNLFEPGDNLFMLEGDIYIADHESLASGDSVIVYFILKMGNEEVRYNSTLTITKPAASNVLVLETEFFFTDSSITSSSLFSQGDKIGLTGRVRHNQNDSHIEAYDVRLRILLPNYVKFANSSDPNLLGSIAPDTYNINITSTIITPNYVEFNPQYIFFTDNFEFNITVTVDPYDQMPKGLGELKSTALMRIVCRESGMANPAKYCSKTSYVNYLVDGSECFDDLQVSTFTSCQFQGSTAIDSSVDAHQAGTATGWSPAVRDSQTWRHHISIDFLRKVRLTRITFNSVTNKRTVQSFKLQVSYDGNVFITVCPNILVAGDLPSDCRLQARYARIIIVSLDDSDEEKAIGVSFNWFGCYLEVTPGSCTFASTPLTTTVNNWRHADIDTVNDIIYFCDYSPKRRGMVCYSSADGSTWNVLPSYIGSLAGFDSGTLKMYAWDKKKRTMVGSKNGKQWSLVSSATIPTLSLSSPAPIPGQEKSEFTPVTIGSWTADFDGLMYGGAYKVKWSICCA